MHTPLRSADSTTGASDFAVSFQPSLGYGQSKYQTVGSHVLMRVEKPAGTLTAATTRTSYGCYVLNTQGVAFIYPTPTEIGRVQDFQQWDAQYNTHRTGFSVCEHFGPEAIGPDIAVLLELQDKWVLGTGPLA